MGANDREVELADRRRAELRAEVEKTLPRGLELSGLRDLHIYDVFEIWGVRINVQGIIFSLLAIVVLFPVFIGGLFKTPLWLALLFMVIIVIGVLEWQSTAVSDGLHIKSGKLRKHLDLLIAKDSGRVKAKSGMPHHTHRMLFVKDKVDFTYEEFAEMKGIKGVGITEAMKSRNRRSS